MNEDHDAIHADADTRRIAGQVARELPPLLNIEHQELIRAMERAQANIAMNREYLESRVSDLGGKLDDRYHMQTKALDAAFIAQTTAMTAAFDANEKAVAIVQQLNNTRLDSLTRMLDERYATQTKALDAAFLAQQAAMTTAFSAAEKAVQAALLAAEKAVDKANTASEKRFEAVNEFRAQLGDIIATMMPRTEVGAITKALEDKIADMKSTQDKMGAGQLATEETTRYTRGDYRANMGTYIAVGSAVVSLLAVVIMFIAMVTGRA